MDYVLDGQYARLLRNAGIDPPRLLRAAGLPGNALAGPRPVLAPAQRNALVDALSRLADLRAGASMAQRVRACLVELLPSGRCAAGDAARRLGVSRRTLQHRLGQEGTTFSKELTSLRHDLALGYLSHAEVGVREAAYLLGYLETNSFLRAFRTWTGTGVGQWRAAHGSGAPA